MRRMGKTKKMLTPREYAEEVGVAYTTVMSWLQRNLIPGAVRNPMPFGAGHYYQVPAGAPMPNLTPGRPAKKPSKKSSKR